MRLAILNQWDGMRAALAGAPADIQLEAVSRADEPDWAEPLKGIPWEILESNSELKNRADKLAGTCRTSGNLAGMERIAINAQVQPPSDKYSGMGRVARLTCPRWWRRQLRKVWGQVTEDALRKIGRVHRGRAAYVTDFTARRRKHQRLVMYSALQAALLVSDAGDEISLESAWHATTSNPTNRRHEFMTRLRGFEEIAAAEGHVARFMTLTAPSAFHPYTTVGGAPRPNANYNGTAARQAQAWLNRVWARCRAKFKRDGLLVYGFRIAEPHHDGTPHWHLLLWMPAKDRASVRRVIRRYMWSEYADERGMRKHRFNTKIIHPERGSAVGYAAKYIAKNIDGFNVDGDAEAGVDAQEGSQRVESWATCNRIRQFQQIGGAPVQLYREFRRLRSPLAHAELEALRSPADSGDWAAFIKALGGIHTCNTSRFKLARSLTGELNCYNDLKAPSIEGITDGKVVIPTRHKSWRIKWNSRPSIPPWTRGNNCTLVPATTSIEGALRSPMAKTVLANVECGTRKRAHPRI